MISGTTSASVRPYQPEDVLYCLQEFGLHIRRAPITSRGRFFIVEDPDSNRIDKMQQFIQQYPLATPKNYKTVDFNGFTIEFKNANSREGNAGNKFELQVVQDLKIKGSRISLIFREFILKKYQVDIYSNDILVNMTVRHIGQKETRRTIRQDLLNQTSPTLLALPASVSSDKLNGREIGIALADILVDIPGVRRSVAISVKHGPSLSMLNAGIRANGKLTWRDSIYFILSSLDCSTKLIDYSIKELDTLAQKREYFTNINENTTALQSLASEHRYINPLKLSQFLKAAVGSEYLMLHDYHAYWVSSKVCDAFSTSTSSIEIAPPSAGRKERARIDIKLVNAAGMKVSLVIRSKAGGRSVFPTTLCVDYRENLPELAKLTQIYTG